MKTRKLTLLITILIFILSFIYIYNITTFAQDSVLYGGEIQNIYLLGESITVPSSQITYNGLTRDSDFYIQKPSGYVYKRNGITLDEIGEYTVQFTAQFGKKNVSKYRTFTVVKNLFEVDGTSSAEYGVSPVATDTSAGIVVSLKNGDTFTYNKPLILEEGLQSIFSLFVTPSESGIYDARFIYVTLTDIYDEENYVTFALQCSEGTAEWGVRMVFVAAGSSKQLLSGWEDAEEKTILHQGNNWGTAVARSMHGYDIPSVIDVELDYTDKIVYSCGKYIIDFDDPTCFAELWEGFSQNKAILTIKAGQYRSVALDFVITEIMDEDLQYPYDIDTTAPQITIINDNTGVPNGLKNVQYKVFDYTSSDDRDTDIDVSVRVFKNYYSSTKYEIDVINGYFTPSTQGEYFIEYTAKDTFGNKAVEIVNVKVLNERTDTFNIEVQQGNTETSAGTEFIVASYSVSGNIGQTNVFIVATGDNAQYIVEDGKFTPEYAGSYTIRYICQDYVGQTEDSYIINVTNGIAPIIQGEAKLEKYMLKNCFYKLPQLIAIDYSNGSPKTVPVVISSTNADVVVDGFNIKLGVTGTAGDTVIKYTATVGGVSVTREYDVTFVDVGFGAELNLSKYFIGSDVESTIKSDHLELKTYSNSSVEFVKNINSNFAIIADIDSQKNDFQGFEITITSAKNKSQSISMKVQKSASASNKSLFCLNDGAWHQTEGSFYGLGQKKIRVSFDSRASKLLIGDSLILKIGTYQDGEGFAGFDGKEVNLKISFYGVTSESVIKIYSINGQPFENISIDIIKPQIQINEYISKIYKLGSVIALADITALDILDPNITFTLKVVGPIGTTLEDTTGLLLNNVSAYNKYNILLSEYGDYTISYRAVDSNNRTTTHTYSVSVVDEISPVLTVSGDIPLSVQKGEIIKLPEISATDNLSENVSIYLYLAKPNGEIVRLTTNNFKLISVGKYILKIIAFDNQGNSVFLNYEITVL